MNGLFREFQQKDIKLMEKLEKTPFYSGFWCRKRKDKAISLSASYAHGTLLDIGCGMKPYFTVFKPYIEKYYGIEYSLKSVYRDHKADIFGNAMDLPFSDCTVDTILCTEVLEHISNPEKAISEFARILRPNGTLITTAPFFYPVHDPLDFFRYSPDGLADMMKRSGLRIEIVKSLSGTGVTLALLFNLYLFDIGFMWTKWLYPFGVLLRPILLLLCFFVNVGGGIFEFLIPSKHMSFNHLTISQKK